MIQPLHHALPHIIISSYHQPHPTNHTPPQGECRQWKLRFAANLHARAKDELERLTEYIRVCARAFVFIWSLGGCVCMCVYFFYLYFHFYMPRRPRLPCTNHPPKIISTRPHR